MFDNADIVKVLSRPNDETETLSFSNMEKVQELLTKFIAKPSMGDKRCFLQICGVCTCLREGDFTH